MTDTTQPGPASKTSKYGVRRPKVPPFARYLGTSAWRKNRRRVREYALFRAKMNRLAMAAETPAA